MSHQETVLILLFIVATVVAIAARRARVPYTVALVLAGVVMGSFRFFGPPHLTRELVFSLILRGLLFEAAFHRELKEFSRDWGLVLRRALTRSRSASPEALDAVRGEYRGRIQGAEMRLRDLHPRSEQLRADEPKRTRRHLLLVEKEHLIDAACRGSLDREVQDSLLADRLGVDIVAPPERRRRHRNSDIREAP